METSNFGHSILSLEKQTEENYQGIPYDIGWKRLYGGHLIAQSLYANNQHSQKRGSLNSFHSQFLHVGNCVHNINYTINPLRIGLNSSTSQIRATQNNRLLFQITATYGPETLNEHVHIPQMPDVPPPEEVPSDREMLLSLRERFSHSKGLETFVERRLSTDTGLDIRPILPKNFLDSAKKIPTRLLWFRMRTQCPSEINKLLLAYTSDFLLVGTALQPHSLSILNPNIKFVSLDHSMWFYDHPPLNQWILLYGESEIFSGGRCLVHGKFFSENGKFLAKCTQEGFVNIKTKREKT